MDMKEAVAKAKDYIRDMYIEEDISNIGLEEIEYDDGSGIWGITIGFSRPWNTPRPIPARSWEKIAGATTSARKRTYKIVKVDPLGRVLSSRTALLKVMQYERADSN